MLRGSLLFRASSASVAARAMAVRTPSPFDSPPVSPLSPRGPPRREILFESYLQKTPPLEKIFVSWRKRYFVLSRTDPLDSSTVELNYYMDNTCKEKRGSINLAKFVSLCPNAKVGSKDHGFAVETEERKYILRAPDAVTKNIWIAKLCQLCGQEQVYHVTLPQQPTAHQAEAILKLYPRDQVVVLSPTTGARLLEIPFKNIRRMGNMDAYSTDLIWFETCNSHHKADQFHFFVVRAGLQTTHQILRELKTATECATGHLLITEESNGIELSFISRQHYGCSDFPPSTRNNVLHSSLRFFSQAITASTALSERERRASEPMKPVRNCESTTCLSLEEFASNKQRRGTCLSSTVHPLMTSRRPTAITLDRFRSNGSYSSSSHLSGSGSGDLSDSGVLNDVFDRGSIASSIVSHHSSRTSREHTPVHAKSSPEKQVTSPSSPYAPTVPPRSRVSLQHEQGSFTPDN